MEITHKYNINNSTTNHMNIDTNIDTNTMNKTENMNNMDVILQYQKEYYETNECIFIVMEVMVGGEV